MHYESQMAGDRDKLNRYNIMQAIALQQKLQSIPVSVSSRERSPAKSPSSHPARDVKTVRPFKAYPRDPLSNPFASIATPDPLTDRASAEKYTSFRHQMLETIRAANGGRRTVTNPKMRRISTKHFTEYEQSRTEVDMHDEQQQALEMQASCASDSSENGGKQPIKDNAYFERRKKNNAAAKKSRDRRRIKEDEIAIRAAYLERENMELKIQLATTQQQLKQFIGSHI